MLERGIIFIDLAIAQLAGVGVIAAHAIGLDASGAMVQLAAFSAAIAGALLLYWTERSWPDVQEAIIGSVFVLGATAAILLLAQDPMAGEHLKDLLLGQILWWQLFRSGGTSPDLVGGSYVLVWGRGSSKPCRLLWSVCDFSHCLRAVGWCLSAVCLT